MATSGESYIAVGSGGFILFPCWRSDLGIVPLGGTVSIPDLDIPPQPFSIMRDGQLRATFPRAKSLAVGDHQVVWDLVIGVDSNDLDNGMEPITQEISVVSTLHLVMQADIPAADLKWRDAAGLPTPAYMRDKQLFGVPFIDGNGRMLSDEATQIVIDGARAYLETMCDITIGSHLVSSLLDPEAMKLINPFNLPVVAEDGYDFTAQRQTQAASYIRLRHRPLQSILRMDLYLGTLQQTTIPLDWVLVQHDEGSIQLLPSAKSQLAVQGLYIPLLAAAAPDRPIPQMFRFAYMAGQKVTPDLFEVISWIAARQLLIIISDSILGGIASSSISVDGISQSISTTSSAEYSTYGANIGELTKRVEEFMKNTVTRYRGIIMGG